MNIANRQPKLVILVSNENAANIINEFTSNNIKIIYATRLTSNELWCEFFQLFLPQLLSNCDIAQTIQNYLKSTCRIQSIETNFINSIMIKDALDPEFFKLTPNNFCPTFSLPMLDSIEIYGNTLLQNLIEFILLLKKKRSRSILIKTPNSTILDEFFLIVSHYFLYRQIFCCTLIILETFLPGIYDYLEIESGNDLYSELNIVKICSILSNLFHVMILLKDSNLNIQENRIKLQILDSCPKVKVISFKINEPNIPIMIKNEFE